MDGLDDLLDPGIRNTGPTNNKQEPLPNANAVLVLGILSIVGCFMFGLPGLICGVISLGLYPRDKRTYESDPRKYEVSYKNSKAGMICAIIGTSLSFIAFLSIFLGNFINLLL